MTDQKSRPVSHLVVAYGPPKMGKTLDLGLTFPTGYFFTPALSTLTPLEGLAGFVPQKKAVVDSFKKINAWLKSHKDDETIAGLVVDDIALIGDHVLSQYTKDMGSSYDRWNALNEDLLEFFDLTTSAAFYTAVTSHEIGPAEIKNTWVPGGPKLPSKPAGDAMAKNAGCILRTIVDSTSSAQDGWPVIYSCDRSDANFVYGDRNGFALPQNPLNMRELLHAGGVNIPRLFDWQEEIVEKLAELIVSGKLTADVLGKARAKMVGHKASDKAVWWTLRDARARAYHRKHAVDRLAGMEQSLLSAHGML